jgi:hypothetical protein
MEEEVNKNSCFWCGEYTEDFEETPSGVKLYVCILPECNKHLREELNAAYEEDLHQAETHVNQSWGIW